MQIIIDGNNNKYIDKDLFDYINKIWLNYDIIIPDDSNLFFSKNTTVHRLMSDYSSSKDIRRVIKREKAEYVLIKNFELNSFPQYYDSITNSITQDDSKEPVYGIYNMSFEDQSTIEMIYYFIVNKQDVKYVNQDKFNESFNNGSVIDVNNYNIYSELINSESADNHRMAVNMLVNSDLKANWQWILYLYHKQQRKILDWDKSNVCYNYIRSVTNKYVNDLFEKTDSCLDVITDSDVKNCMVQMIRAKFQKEINNYLKATIGTDKFLLKDFKLDLK